MYYKIARHYLWGLTNVFDGPEDYQAGAQWDAKSERKESMGICGDYSAPALCSASQFQM